MRARHIQSPSKVSIQLGVLRSDATLKSAFIDAPDGPRSTINALILKRGRKPPSNRATMKKQVLFGLAVIGITTLFTAPARAGVSFGFHFGLPIPVPVVTFAPPVVPIPCAPQVVLAPPPFCPAPVVVVRPPVVFYPPPVAYYAPPVSYCAPPVVVVPVYARPYGYAYGRWEQHRGGERCEHRGWDHDHH